MRWVIGCLALVLAVPAAAGAQQVEVTLTEAIQRALQVQPAMVQARGDQRTAGANTNRKRAAAFTLMRLRVRPVAPGFPLHSINWSRRWLAASQWH